MADYITAYQSTGRPPAPVPQFPADAAARAQLGLPPLFAPQPVASSSTSTSGLGSALGSSLAGALGPQRIVRAADLPPAQEFRLRTADAERYHTISCMSEYEFFSHEVRLGSPPFVLPVVAYGGPLSAVVLVRNRSCATTRTSQGIRLRHTQSRWNHSHPSQLRKTP